MLYCEANMANSSKWRQRHRTTANVTWPQGFVWHWCEQMANASSWHFSLSEQCAQLFEDLKKAWVFSVSAFILDVRSAGRTQQGLPINTVESSESWVKALQDHHAPIFWKGTSVVLAHLCPRRNKTWPRKETLFNNKFYFKYEMFYCRGTVFVLHMSWPGFKSQPNVHITKCECFCICLH